MSQLLPVHGLSPLDASEFLRCSVDILMHLDGTGRIIAVSDSYEDLTGDAPGEARGRSCLEYVAQMDVARTADEIGWVLRHGAETSGFENLVRDRQGGFRVVSWRGVARKDGTICAIGRDVSGQRHPEQRASEAQRAHASLALVNAAQQANSSLAATLGLMEVGRRRTREQPTRDWLDQALKVGRRSSDLMQRVLAAAQGRELPPDLPDPEMGLSLVAFPSHSHAHEEGRDGMSQNKAIRLRYFSREHSVFVDDKYLIRGAAGALLWKLVSDYVANGKSEVSTRELRVATDLPFEIESNLDSRLVQLRQRLLEKKSPIQVERVGRGEYRVRVDAPLQLEVRSRS